MDEFREQGGTGSAAAARGAGGAGLGWASVGHVHEEPKLVVDVQLRIGGFAEALPVALALLIVLAVEGSECGAPNILGEALPEIGVEVQAAGLSLGTLGRAHASHGEGADDVLIAELDKVAGAVAEELDDHVPCDAHLVLVLGAEEAAQATGQTEVRPGTGEGGGELRLPMARDDGVHDALEGGFGWIWLHPWK
jgi:hypothetical protein